MRALKKSGTSTKKQKGWVVLHELRKFDEAWLKEEAERLGLTGVTFVVNPLPPKS